MFELLITKNALFVLDGPTPQIITVLSLSPRTHTFSLSLSLSHPLQTPLIIAAKNGHYSCVKLLISHGAELKRKTSRLGQNQEAWQIAKRAGQTRVASYIQQCIKDKEKLGTTRAQLEGGTVQFCS